MPPAERLKRRARWPRSLAVLLAVALCNLAFLLPSTPRPPFSRAPSPTHVTIWPTPRSCNGVYTTAPAAHSATSFPYAVLRDAVLDMRPARPRTNSSHLVLLHVTTHLSARLSAVNGTLSVGGADGAVEFVTHVCPFLTNPLTYRPGKLARFRTEVTEWQVGLRLPPLPTDWKHLLLNASIRVVRFDNLELSLRVELPLRCVQGLPTIPGVRDTPPTCANGLSETTGAVLLSGGALHGEKKRDREHYREIANYAARALQGPVRFDAVAVSVVTDHSAEDLARRCGTDGSCRAGMEENNARRLRDIAEVVEEEMALIGVPRSLFDRVSLIPMCTLGSAALGSEKDDPCGASEKHGQYQATFFSYVMLAPFYKWAASYDLDEYLAPSRSRNIFFSKDTPRPAAEVFDTADKSITGKQGDLIFQWLNFRIPNNNDSRTLTSTLIRGLHANLEDPKDRKGSAKCYARRGVSTGKSAVRCDVGLGFTIHHPVVPAHEGSVRQGQGSRMYRGLRAWHGRVGQGYSSTKCDYVAPEAVDLRMPCR